jgi:hypothetical protein
MYWYVRKIEYYIRVGSLLKVLNLSSKNIIMLARGSHDIILFNSCSKFNINPTLIQYRLYHVYLLEIFLFLLHILLNSGNILSHTKKEDFFCYRMLLVSRLHLMKVLHKMVVSFWFLKVTQFLFPALNSYFFCLFTV